MKIAELVPDELWKAVEPCLPRERPKPKGGRPRVPDRVALAGIVYVARLGVRWRDVPRAIGCGGLTCWRRLREWQVQGVWEGVHRTLLNWLGDLGIIDLSRASLDSTSVRRKRGRGDRAESDRSGQAR